MNYDEAIQRAETIIAQLESSQAISMEEFNRRAEEVTQLLDFCKKSLQESYSA